MEIAFRITWVGYDVRGSGWCEKMVLQDLQRYLWTDFIFACLMPDLITFVDMHLGQVGLGVCEFGEFWKFGEFWGFWCDVMSVDDELCWLFFIIFRDMS